MIPAGDPAKFNPLMRVQIHDCVIFFQQVLTGHAGTDGVSVQLHADAGICHLVREGDCFFCDGILHKLLGEEAVSGTVDSLKIVAVDIGSQVFHRYLRLAGERMLLGNIDFGAHGCQQMKIKFLLLHLPVENAVLTVFQQNADLTEFRCDGVYKVPVLKPVMDVLMALSKAFPMNLVLLIFYLIWTTQFSSIAAFFHSQKTIKDVSLMYVAVAALVFCSLASISEIIRSGLISVDKGQYEAGYASGLTKAQTFFHVIVPQAVRAVIPPLTNDILSLVKGTALVSVIGVSDILTDSINAASAAYSYLEAYVAAAMVFWGIGIVLERLSHYVERKFSKSVKTLAG